MTKNLAQAIADGLNELGYSVDVPNEQGEMKFGPECHEVQTILQKVRQDTELAEEIQGIRKSFFKLTEELHATKNQHRRLDIISSRLSDIRNKLLSG